MEKPAAEVHHPPEELLGGIGFLLGGRMTQMPVAGVAFTGWGYNPLWGQDTVETSYPDGSVRKLDFELTCMDVQILEPPPGPQGSSLYCPCRT